MKKRIIAWILTFSIFFGTTLGTYQTASATDLSTIEGWEDVITNGSGLLPLLMPWGDVAYILFALLGLGVVMDNYDSIEDAGEAMWAEFENFYYDIWAPSADAFDNNMDVARNDLAQWLEDAENGIFNKACDIWDALKDFAQYVQKSLTMDNTPDTDFPAENVEYSDGSICIKAGTSFMLDSNFLNSKYHEKYSGYTSIVSVEGSAPVYMCAILYSDGLFIKATHYFYSKEAFSFVGEIQGCSTYGDIVHDSEYSDYGYYYTAYYCSYAYDGATWGYGLGTTVYYDSVSAIEAMIIAQMSTDLADDEKVNELPMPLENDWTIPNTDATDLPGEVEGDIIILNPDGTRTRDETEAKDASKDVEDTLTRAIEKEISWAEAWELLNVYTTDTDNDSNNNNNINIPADTDPTKSDLFLNGLEEVFPFCIPFDIYKLFSLLASKPVAPVVDWKFIVLGKSFKLHIDLSDWNSVAELARLLQCLAFCVGLSLKTRPNLIRS